MKLTDRMMRIIRDLEMVTNATAKAAANITPFESKVEMIRASNALNNARREVINQYYAVEDAGRI